MIDFPVFIESNYVSTSWINDNLKILSTEESLESTISSISMKLHIMSQDYTDQLETSMVESMSTMPRILNEINKIEVQLKLTEREMNSVSTQLNTFDERNFSGVEDLSRLDFAKFNMEKCKSTLEEHARWSQLVREAQSMFNENEPCTLIAEKIETMFRSLKILENLPGHDERRSTCETMKTSLLQSLIPKVKRGILSNDFAVLHDFLYVYKKMGREKELEEQYITTRPADTAAAWSQISGNFVTDVIDHLSRVSQFVAGEESSVVQLFGADRGLSLLCDMLQCVFKPIHVSFIQNILSVSDAFEFYCAVEKFLERMLPMLIRVGQRAAIETVRSIFSSLVAYLPTYVDSEDKEVRQQLLDLISVVTFGCLEITSEGEDLDDSLFVSERDPGARLNAYSDSLVCAVDSVHKPFNVSLRRAVCFMGGVRSKAVIKCLFVDLVEFAKQISLRIDHLAVASGVIPAVCRQGKKEVGQPNSSVEALSLAQQLDSSDIDIRILITCSLRALQAVGRFLLRVDQVKHSMIQALLELSESVFPIGHSVVSLRHVLDSSISCATFSVLQDIAEASEMRSFLALSASSQRQNSQDMVSSILTPSLRRLQLSACDLLFNLSIALPDKLLSDMVADDCWSSSHDSVHAFDSLLPQPVVTQVGEHLLSLVQELEAFASSDAMEDLLFVHEQTDGLVARSRGWQQMRQILHISDNVVLARVCQKINSEKALDILAKALFVSHDSLSDKMDSFPEEEDVDGGAVLVFVNEWLAVISDAAIGMFVSKMAQVGMLTIEGVAQLLTDLNYLCNVTRAMGIRPHPLLIHVKRLLEARSIATNMLEAVEVILSSTGGDVQSLARFDKCILQAVIRGEAIVNKK